MEKFTVFRVFALLLIMVTFGGCSKHAEDSDFNQVSAKIDNVLVLRTASDCIFEGSPVFVGSDNGFSFCISTKLYLPVGDSDLAESDPYGLELKVSGDSALELNRPYTLAPSGNAYGVVSKSFSIPIDDSACQIETRNFKSVDGQVVFTDYDGAFISGTFEFSAVHQESGLEVPVQEGIFKNLKILQR